MNNMPWAEQLSSGRWRAVYRAPDGRKKSAGTFPRKTDATFAAHKAAMSNQPASSAMTWGEWETQWHAGRTVEKSTRITEESKLRVHVRPRWGTVPLGQITRDDVQRWVVELGKPVSEGGKGLSPSTVQKLYRLLSGSLRAAVNADLISRNPCTDISLPRIGPTPDRFLEADEVAAIRAPLEADDQFVMDVLVGTGLRWGEAVGLHWEHVDLVRKVISVEWAYSRETGEMKPPKDHQRRSVPIGDALARELSVRVDESGWGSPAPVPYREGRRVRSGLVLAQSDSRPPDGSNFSKRFEAACRVAWVGKGKARRTVGHVRIHDLRHTYASRLLRAGVSLEQVSKLLGHASLLTTQRYAHLAQAQWNQVRDALN
jgi:integrase